MNSIRIALLQAIAGGCLLTGFIDDASAKPAYAQKEGVACIHCHVSANPGGVDLGESRDFQAARHTFKPHWQILLRFHDVIVYQGSDGGGDWAARPRPVGGDTGDCGEPERNVMRNA